MNAFVVSTILHVLAIYGYEFKCPDKSHLRIYSKAACPNPLDFACLLDALENKYRTHCFISRPIAPGYKYVFRPWYDSEKCEPNRYQPFVFIRNQQTDCIYLKSSCNEEGQITYSNGSTTSDVKCKCDEKNGYTFVTQPNNKLFCTPSAEDCSCYQKPKSITPDNEVNNSSGSFLTIVMDNTMTAIIHLMNTKLDDPKYTIQERELYKRQCAISLTVTLCCMVLIYLLLVFVASKYLRHLERKNMRKQIMQWEKDDKLFIETKASSEVLRRAMEKSCVVITGAPGSGKTIIARHTALMMRKEDYSIVPVNKADDIKRYYKTGKKIVFVFDDLFGRFEMNQRIINNWTSVELVLKNRFLKILATCRLQIFCEAKEKIDTPFKLVTECNICLRSLSYDFEERKQIAHNYLKGDTVDLSVIYEFFPLLCKLFKGKDSHELQKCLSNPFTVLEKDIENLFRQDKDGRIKSCGIILCLLLNNESGLTKADLGCEELRGCIKDVLQECQLPKSVSREEILSSLKGLESVYISIIDGKYDIIHNKLFDFLSIHFGNKMPLLFIKYSNHNFIRERFLWTDNKTQESETERLIMIDQNNFEEYLTRLEADLNNGWVQSVFHNRHMKSEIFRQAFISFLENRSEQRWINNQDNINGETPLYQCCLYYYNDLEFVKWLLNQGAKNETGRPDNSTPLHMTCKEGHVEIVNLLIQHYYADINKSMKNGITPLLAAIFYNHIDIVNVLLKCRDIEIDKCDDNKTTPLFMACKKGHEEMVKILLQHSACINKSTKEGATPLHIACEHGCVEVVRILMQNSVEINMSMKNGVTPLYIACEQGRIGVVRKLIQHFADINISTNNGTTPLQVASYKNHFYIVNELLQRKEIEIDQRDDNGCTALYIACQRGYVEIVKSLIQHSAHINISNNDGATPLHIACETGHVEVVRILIQESADVNIRMNNGTTPLHMACQNGHVDMAKLLVQNSADINKPNNNGEMPLCLACQNRHVNVIRELLNMHLKDGSPLKIAKRYKYRHYK